MVQTKKKKKKVLRERCPYCYGMVLKKLFSKHMVDCGGDFGDFMSEAYN